MKTHANILDMILDTPTVGSKTASSTNLGDVFMDTDTRSLQHGRGAWANKSAAGDLAEAADVVGRKNGKTAMQKAMAVKFASIAEAASFAASLTPKSAKAKKTAAFKNVQDANKRLQRVLARTASQMLADGAIAHEGYLNANRFPKLAAQLMIDLCMLTTLRNNLPATKVAMTESTEDILKDRNLSDAETRSYVKNLLNQGVTPEQVAAKIEKQADLQGFSKSIATETLNQHAGVLGYAFMEPNHYMNDCTSTAERMKAKMGGVRAQSVRRIAACTGCQHFRKDASGSPSCGTYGLPIVANQKELMPIINNLTAGSKDKRAALVSLANREHTRYQPKAASQHSDTLGRTQRKAHVPARQQKAVVKTFTASDVLNQHNAGVKMASIYSEGSTLVGPREAGISIKKFIAGLKGTQTKVALTQIDCTLLKQKLGSSNAIYGASKCASCTYRTGAHCGLTGGTLVAYPGMDTAKTNHRVASGAPKDGMAVIEEFEMLQPTMPSDIEMYEPQESVELNAFSKVDL